jgi:hypothetical protein
MSEIQLSLKQSILVSSLVTVFFKQYSNPQLQNHMIEEGYDLEELLENLRTAREILEIFELNPNQVSDSVVDFK